MATKPTEHLEFATDHTLVTGNPDQAGDRLVEMPVSDRRAGFGYRKAYVSAWGNFVFNLIDRWLKWLAERAENLNFRDDGSPGTRAKIDLATETNLDSGADPIAAPNTLIGWAVIAIDANGDVDQSATLTEGCGVATPFANAIFQVQTTRATSYALGATASADYLDKALQIQSGGPSASGVGIINVGVVEAGAIMSAAPAGTIFVSIFGR